MKSIGLVYSSNRKRGHEIELAVAREHYGLFVGEEEPYDVDFEFIILEVKSCVEWVSSKTDGVVYRKPGRFLMREGPHEELVGIASRMGKEAYYCFVGTPRHDDGRIETRLKKFKEKWISWHDVDRMVKESGKKRSLMTKWHGQPVPVKYYYLYYNEVFAD